MKMKNLSYAVLCCLAAIAFSSCSNKFNDDVIWDFSPLTLEFYVIDNATGANLLDSSIDGNILSENITIEYNGNVYNVLNINDPAPWPSEVKDGLQTRYYAPLNLGLRYISKSYIPKEDADGYKQIDFLHLEFGEFDSTDDLHNQEMVIKWSDGSSNKIVFDCYITWKNGTPKLHHDVWKDGEKIEGNKIYFYR